jgi:hypothetical protein
MGRALTLEIGDEGKVKDGDASVHAEEAQPRWWHLMVFTGPRPPMAII